MTEGPLGAEDLGAATEGIREDIQMARNKLRYKTNLIVLAEMKNGLSHEFSVETTSQTDGLPLEKRPNPNPRRQCAGQDLAAEGPQTDRQAMGLDGPPLKISEAGIVPAHRSGIGKEETGSFEAELQRSHPKTRPRNDGGQGRHHP